MVRHLLLVLGVFACSTSVLMIKASTLHPAVLSAYRLLMAAALLSPLFWRALRRHRGEYTARHLWRSIVPGVTLGLHFISWAWGAQATGAANASLIVNMVPIVMPFLLFVTARELVTRREIIGTVVALLGVFLLTASDFLISRESLMGDLVCFASMLLFSLYLVLGRRNRDFPDIWLYLVPLYGIAGIFCLLVSAFVVAPLTVYAPREYALTLGLAVIPTVIGHSCLNDAMKHLRGQIVGIFNLGQFIFAGLLAYLLFGEAPDGAFYVAGALVVGGACIVIGTAAQPDAATKPDAATAHSSPAAQPADATTATTATTARVV